MNTDARVFVIQHPFKNLDLATAHKYGKVKFLFEVTEAPSLAPAQAYVDLVKQLKDFDEEKDYLLFVGGDTLGFAIAIAVLCEMGITHVCCLRWERQRDGYGRRLNVGYYVPVRIPLTYQVANPTQLKENK